MPHDFGVFVPHVGLRATVGLAVVGHGLVSDQRNRASCYSQADSVVEVNERFRRFSASPFLSSM